jgi:phage repressor protein C with HTH and peptisase S24 domain
MIKSAKSDNPPESRRQSAKSDFPMRLIESLRGRSMKWLSDASGLSTRTLSDYKSGKMPSADKAALIAKALGVDLRWLITGEGRAESPPASTQSAIADDRDFIDELGVVGVEEIDLAVGMGHGYLDESAIGSVTRWMPSEGVRQFTDAPASMLAITRPFGDSMYPTINDRDIILFDRSARSIDRQDAIWVLAYGGLGTIKRVRAMPDGSYKLMSDNEHVREEAAHDGEMYVIGRVVGVLRRT